MFSAFVFSGNNNDWPKNGPVPGRPVNGYLSWTRSGRNRSFERAARRSVQLLGDASGLVREPARLRGQAHGAGHAHRVFRVRDAVVCTQTFHLYRSVFLARRAGIDAVGMISDLHAYRRGRRDRLREYLARTLAFADSYLLDTDPHFFGPPIPVDGPPQDY